MRIFLSAGEASGDAYAAALVREIRAQSQPANDIFEGVGGDRLEAAGALLHAKSSQWGAISITQALRLVPRVLGGYYRAKRALGRGKPGLFIPIDFGYANIRLARHAKNRGWKVLYFVPPGSWRRDRQGKDLPAITDVIVTPFSWSAEILNRMGANAHWFGHPIKQLIRDARQSDPAKDRSLAVLPGSRNHEIEANLPVLAEALRDQPMRLRLALAPTVEADRFEQQWRRLCPLRNDELVLGDTVGVLSGARAAIVCSGTATLEAALCRCPMVVIYRLTASMRREAKLLRIKRPTYVALPNILLDRVLVPELVEDEATPGAIRAWVERLLEDGPDRRAQLTGFEELDQVLGPADAITKTAELALATYSP